MSCHGYLRYLLMDTIDGRITYETAWHRNNAESRKVWRSTVGGGYKPREAMDKRPWLSL